MLVSQDVNDTQRTFKCSVTLLMPVATSLQQQLLRESEIILGKMGRNYPNTLMGRKFPNILRFFACKFSSWNASCQSQSFNYHLKGHLFHEICPKGSMCWFDMHNYQWPTPNTSKTCQACWFIHIPVLSHSWALNRTCFIKILRNSL